jgi:2-succinyl-6-hydroxy-2,4-cyclohexadiene-1-carboxylate synthase
MMDWVLKPKMKRISVRHGEVCFWCWYGIGIPVLYLHGFGGSGSDAEGWLHALSSPVNVISPDLPGHGQTRILQEDGYDVPGCVEALSYVVKDLGCDRFVLMGYSMGGRVALEWATRFPETLAALVTIGATPGLAAEEDRISRREWDWDMASKARTLGNAAFVEQWLSLPILSTRERIPEPWKSRALDRRRLGESEGWAKSLEQAGTGSMEPLWNRLNCISVPALLVAGEEDLKYRELAGKMAEKMDAAQLAVIEGAGHAAHLEAPVAFAEALETFLRRVGADKKKPG